MEERDQGDRLRRRDDFHLGIMVISWIDNSPFERNVSVGQWNVTLFTGVENNGVLREPGNLEPLLYQTLKG